MCTCAGFYAYCKWKKKWGRGLPKKVVISCNEICKIFVVLFSEAVRMLTRKKVFSASRARDVRRRKGRLRGAGYETFMFRCAKKRSEACLIDV